MNQARRVAGVVVVGLVLATLAAVALPPASSATAGTVSNFAGGLGQGPATNLAMTPTKLAWSNGRLLITDDRYGRSVPPLDYYPGIVRALDTTTGVATVLAGLGGPGGYSGDGGPSDKADLRAPAGLASDAKGNLYLADAGNNRVRRIGPDGIVTTFAGNGSAAFSGDGGPAKAASLSSPAAVAVAPDGSVLIADQGNGRLRRVDPSGRISTIAGSGGPAPSPPPTSPTLSDVRPANVAVDATGIIYFVDGASAKLLRLSTTGALSEVATGLQWQASAVAVERAGTLLVAGQATLRRVDPGTGRIDLVAGTVDQSGFGGDGGPATSALIGDVRGLAVDDAGAIYLADRSNLRVRRIGPEGIITTVAGNGMVFSGGEGGPATSAQVIPASFVRASPTGVYFTQQDTTDDVSRLERVGADGVLRRVADLPPAAVQGMAVDRVGNVYLTEGSQVVKVSSSGTRTVVAGNGQAGLAGDGGPAVDAQLGAPGALALDGAGNLYIADNYEGAGANGARVRRVDPGGRISTFTGGAPIGTGQYTAAVSKKAHLLPITDLTVDARGSLAFISGGILWRDTCGVTGTPSGLYDWTLKTLQADATGALYATADQLYATFLVQRIDAYGHRTTLGGGGTETRYIGRPVSSLALRGTGAMSLDAAGNILLAAGDGIVRVENSAAPAAVPGMPCETVPDHAVWAWGSDVLGQLGDGATVDEESGHFEDPPVTGAVAVTGGGYHSLALKADGTVWAWGWNGFGQLGDGTTTMPSRAVQVAGLTGVKAIAAGAFDSLALKADGTVWAWGWNGFGQLGDGTTTDRLRPVQVAGLRNVKAISANVVHSMAVTTDGTAWAWGWNGFGLLGDGTTVERHVPGRVLGLAGVTAVAAGYYHSLALTADGRVWGWGWNAQGQLGDGTTRDAHVPVRALGVTNATAVAAGNNHSVAIVAGKIWTWGWNALAQLGSSSTDDRSTPAPASFPSGVVAVAVAAGAYHTLVLTQDNVLMSWGWDQFLQSTYFSVPDRPVAIGAGSYTSMAVFQFTP